MLNIIISKRTNDIFGGSKTKEKKERKKNYKKTTTNKYAEMMAVIVKTIMRILCSFEYSSINAIYNNYWDF